MLVEVSPSVESLSFLYLGRSVMLKKGDQMQVDASEVIRLLEGGQLRKAEYPGIVNNEVAVIDYVNEKDWRPIGRLQKREGT